MALHTFGDTKSRFLESKIRRAPRWGSCLRLDSVSNEEKVVEIIRYSTREIRRKIRGGMAIVQCNNSMHLAVEEDDGVWRDGRNEALKVIGVVMDL